MLAGLDANQSMVKAYLWSSLLAESASQLLSLVYLFHLSPYVGRVKSYYRLLPLRFVTLTVTFTGNLRKTIGKNHHRLFWGQICLLGTSVLAAGRGILELKRAD